MFGVNMAKKLLKKVKKAAKSVSRPASTLQSRKAVEVSSAKPSARSHVESLSKKRRDAAVVWGMIKDGNHSTDEIKAICKEKGFDTLLGEL
jgi:hypothetical protein